MTLTILRTRMLPWLGLAGLGLAAFFWGAVGGRGLPFEGLGLLLLSVGAWASVDALHRAPASEGEAAVAPGEWQAWVGVAFVGAILAAMLAGAQALSAPVPLTANPAAGALGRGVGGLFVAWLVLSQVLEGRWAGQVQRDERDAQIALRASQWGRGSTGLFVFGVAALLGLSDPAQLSAWGGALLGHLLTVALVWGLWVDQVVSATLYWRDRRAAA